MSSNGAVRVLSWITYGDVGAPRCTSTAGLFCASAISVVEFIPSITSPWPDRRVWYITWSPVMAWNVSSSRYGRPSLK